VKRVCTDNAAAAAAVAVAFAIVFCGVGMSRTALADERPSEIKSDEHVTFFPALARLSEDGKHWEANVHGWIFEPERGDLLRTAAIDELRDLLDLDAKEPANKIFAERARLFLVDNERGKRIGVRLAGETFVSEESAADGHFTARVRIDAEKIGDALKKSRIVRYEAALEDDDKRKFVGEIHCLAAEGISVISDIDDTIKITEVTSKQTLLRNTFFREFRAVEGMAEVYRNWAKEGHAFHYVSAAPWQLYEPLREFSADNQFPAGTYHLKNMRLKDETFFNLFADPVEYKLAILEPLFAQYPKRTFILVGDSGEKDPEIYGHLARRFPERVEKIYIRDVTGEKREATRYKKAFADVGGAKWKIFDDPTAIEWRPRE
jgi:phosphatidate phosphatase APP1